MYILKYHFMHAEQIISHMYIACTHQYNVLLTLNALYRDI